MKKNLILLFMLFLCLIMCTAEAEAASQVPEMEIEVALQPDGSACVTQIWTTDTDEGTEFYLGLNDSGYLSVTDFSVSDQNGSYTFIEQWDVDVSLDMKAGKCGIVETDDGAELCWGISEYGENRYVIEYVLHDLVGAYSDADGFNHRFVDEMSFFPTDVVLTICNQDGTPLDDTFCDIWAFGFDGQIRFMDSCEKDGLQTLIRGGCLKGAVCDDIGSLTGKGQRELDEILGLKRFLLDFSLIRERGVKETVIWQDYMVYALLLGIADKLAPQIRELYPESVPQLEQYQRYISYTGFYNGLMYSAWHRERQRREAARNTGSGGRASFGGGGGFSGGGGGGIR